MKLENRVRFLQFTKLSWESISPPVSVRTIKLCHAYIFIRTGKSRADQAVLFVNTVPISSLGVSCLVCRHTCARADTWLTQQSWTQLTTPLPVTSVMAVERNFIPASSSPNRAVWMGQRLGGQVWAQRGGGHIYIKCDKSGTFAYLQFRNVLKKLSSKVLTHFGPKSDIPGR